MLALQACFSLHGSSQVLAGKVCFQAFSKLGGNQLGSVYLGEVNQTNLVQTIKDLQRQAALLLRHPKRTSNYMKLVLDNIALPSLTYRDDMTEEVKHQALRCLQGANHVSKIGLSWDEDDTEALQVLQDRFFLIERRPRVTFIFDTPCPELGVLAYSNNVARGVEEAIVLGVYADFSFLEYLPELETLYIGGFGYTTATIKTWHFARNLTLKSLGLVLTKLEAPSFAELEHLEFLRVRDTQISPDMFKGCTKLTRIELVEYPQKLVDELRMALQHITIVSK
jgi:hypothetical protein